MPNMQYSQREMKLALNTLSVLFKNIFLAGAWQSAVQTYKD
jgi:hypothetical protein